MFGKFVVRLIKCDNMEEMTEFYRDTVGLQVTMDQRPDFVAFDDGNGGEVVLGRSAAVGGARITLAFTGSTNLSAAREALLDRNPSEIEPHDTGKSFWIQDPDGNYIGFAD